MRRIDFSEWRKRKSQVVRARLAADAAFGDADRGNRPRDPDSERILCELDRARWARCLESGRIERLGPKQYRLRTHRPG